MPVIAVAGAVFAGASIATVGIAAMSTMAVISAVGAIAAGVGVVTGNKALTKIGGVAALVGGVGAFAQGQGWLSGDLAGGADATMANAGANATPELSNTGQMIAEAAPGVTDPTAGLVGSTDPTAGNYTNAMDMASDAAGAAGAGGEVAAAAGGASPTGLMNSAGPTGSGLDSVNGADLMSDMYKGPGAGGFGANKSSTIFDTLKDVGAFMEKNKNLSSMGLNFVGGMFDDKKKAEAQQAEAASGLYSARTQSELLQQEQLRQQMSNANAVPDLTGLKINPAVKVFNTGAPPVYNAPRAGLINSTGR